MSRYLDPKADFIFKKIFGEHADILISFLNAVLPLKPDEQIQSIEYLPSEQVPTIPSFKNTIVDVKCYDQAGRVFIVEMQMVWSDFFKQRMVFNADKAYIKQLDKGEDYNLLKPVYGLALVNQNFDPSEEWYHHYKLVNIQKPNEEAHHIKHLQLIFVELSKITPFTYAEKKLTVLWLRFLSEINESTKEVDKDLRGIPEINDALALTEESAYTREELESYDTYLDWVRVQKSLLKEQYEQGKAEGKAEGKLEEKQNVALRMLSLNIPVDMIMQATGLSASEVAELQRISH